MSRVPHFLDNGFTAVILSVLRADRALLPEISSGTRFFYRLSKPQGHSAAGRIKLTEKRKRFDGLIGTRIHNLSARSKAPQPTTLARAIIYKISNSIM
jgi:hypothetical protein